MTPTEWWWMFDARREDGNEETATDDELFELIWTGEDTKSIKPRSD